MNNSFKKSLWIMLPVAAAGLGTLLAISRARQKDLSGKVALITGGTRGLGLALAEELGSQGCRVAICGRDEERLEKAKSILESRGVKVLGVPCDVSDRQQVDHLVRAVKDYYGSIDILVNNAGQIRVAPIEDTTVEDFEKAMHVMFWGVVYPTLAVLPEMRSRGDGNIVTITSIGGKVSIPHMLPYSCAKFAAVGFCEGLRTELGKSDVQVTTIVPGLMRTGSHRRAEFGGDKAREYGWFGAGASMPLLSISARSAASKIVRAIRCGRSEKFLTPQAALLSIAHGIAPGFVLAALGEVNRLLLPSSGYPSSTERGFEIEDRLPSWWRTATQLGHRAAESLNQ